MTQKLNQEIKRIEDGITTVINVLHDTSKGDASVAMRILGTSLLVTLTEISRINPEENIGEILRDMCSEITMSMNESKGKTSYGELH